MHKRQKGFTLLEILVVVSLVGIVAAIAAPSWMSFAERNQLATARDQLYTGIREAQSKAQRRGTSWRFSVRERNDKVEWAVHPNSVSPSLAEWEVLSSDSIQIDSETTFASSGDIFYVRFDSRGNVLYRLGRVTLSGKRFPMNKRCVIVSTLIGAMRKAQEQIEPRDGKLCY